MSSMSYNLIGLINISLNICHSFLIGAHKALWNGHQILKNKQEK